MDAREQVLSLLPDGEGEVHREAVPDYVPFNGDLVSLFKDRVSAVGGRVMDLDEARRLCPAPAWVDGDVASIWGSAPTPRDIWEASAGVTSTICAVAQTGSVLLAAGPGRRRLASLAPPVHIALVRRVVATLADAVDLAPRSTCVLVTGPSRTADIEGVLVNGVHGPGELWVVLLEDLIVD